MRRLNTDTPHVPLSPNLRDFITRKLSHGWVCLIPLHRNDRPMIARIANWTNPEDGTPAAAYHGQDTIQLGEAAQDYALKLIEAGRLVFWPVRDEGQPGELYYVEGWAGEGREGNGLQWALGRYRVYRWCSFKCAAPATGHAGTSNSNLTESEAENQ